MAVIFYCDDIAISHPMDAVRLIASLYSVTINHLNSRLEGNPIAFVPINPTNQEILDFNEDYLRAYEFLIPIFLNW